jgi:hypothetical protein
MPLGLGLIMGLGHNVAASGGGGGGGGSGPPYRAFKLNITRTAGDTSSINLSEFEASASSGGTNFLLGAVALSSHDGDFGGIDDNAFDGDTATVWISLAAFPQWIIADLGATSGNWKTPFEFRLRGKGGQEANAPGDFTIQGTVGDPAGSPTWTTLVTVSGGVTGDWSGVNPRTFLV